MNALRLTLIHREALRRLQDAKTLAEANNSNPFSDSSHLLSLLGFELLLKFVYEISLGRAAPPTHKYHALFAALPDEIQTKIVASANARIGRSAIDGNLADMLKEWAENFVALRYPYEKYVDMTEEDYKKLGTEWASRGGQLSEATFRYHPEELFGIVHALQCIADDMAKKSI